MNQNRRRATNTIEVNILARALVSFFFVGLAALFFVYLKNQQHAVGDQSRTVETSLSEAKDKNEALKARITGLTSRGALQRRIDDGYIRLDPIHDTAIARITPAVHDETDGGLRTASRDPEGRFGVGVPLRIMAR